MTPLQIVKAHCDCLNQDASCLGITFNVKLSLIRFRPENSLCLLAGDILQRCSHFEQAILPMEKRLEWAKDARRSASLAADFKQGAHDYRIKTGYMADSIRLCPQCRSSTISQGRKLCDSCKDKNRRSSKSKSDHARNSSQHSHSSSNSDVDNQ